MSYNINLQHIVFRTMHGANTIPNCSKHIMFQYIHSVSLRMGVKMLRINACLNHIHILVDLPVTQSLPEYVRKIKTTSSTTFQRHSEFPLFTGWASGYGSFSVSHYEKNHIINYIKGQEEHHRVKTFQEELESLFGKDFVESDPYWRKNWMD